MTDKKYRTAASQFAGIRYGEVGLFVKSSELFAVFLNRQIFMISGLCRLPIFRGG